MVGQKIDQLKEALKNILLKLRPEDSFNIINFSYKANVWDIIKGDVVPNHNTTVHYATEQNVKRAMQIVDLLQPFGYTDIFTALRVGFSLLEENYRQINRSQPIVMFLTDGQSTIGVGKNDSNIIIEKITPINSHKAGIYSLSLGEDSDKEFLNKLSSKNQGHTTHIYEDSDISLQIEKFFESLSSPSLKNITFNLGPNITQVTQTQFPTAFIGSELIVVGEKLEDTDLSKFQNLSISGDTRNGPVKLVPDFETRTDNMERLWAYAEIKQLLAQRKLMEDKAAITKKALDFALKYSFVTEVTSLVVVKPKDENVVNPVDADFGVDFNEFGATTSRTASFHPTATEFISSIPPFEPSVTPGIEKKAETFDETYINDVTDKNKVVRTESQNVDIIKEQIPWLRTLLLNNGTILRNPGLINLDVSSYSYLVLSCVYTDFGKTIHGNCLRLHDCPVLFKNITNYSVLDKILCPFNDKFMVCCS